MEIGFVDGGMIRRWVGGDVIGLCFVGEFGVFLFLCNIYFDLFKMIKIVILYGFFLIACL